MTAPPSADTHDAPLGPLDRLLAPFAEVRGGEGLSVLVLFANVFLILTAYYVLKVVREALTIGGIELFGLAGDEIKAYLPAVMMVLLIGIVPAYGRLVSAVSRKRLLNLTMAFTMTTLVGFWFWGKATGVGTAIGLSFYVYLGIVNVFLIAQFWSFANDVYTEAQGERLFAIIALGQSMGAVLGPRIAAFGTGRIFDLLLISAGLLGVCLALYHVSDRLSPSPEEAPSEGSEATVDDGPETQDEGQREQSGFGLVLRKPYLLLIALMILVSNIVNTTGEYILANAAKRHAETTVAELPVEREEEVVALATMRLADDPGLDPDTAREQVRASLLKLERSSAIGAFYGEFFFWVNLIGVLAQMFLVSRILKYAGIRAALFVLPLVAFGGYLAIALTSSLVVLRVAKTAENSIDYSLQNTVKQALFLPTTRDEKYKAKAAIDTFFVRLGDTVSAGLVFVGLNVIGFGVAAFAWLNVAMIGLWIGLSAGIARQHRALTETSESEDASEGSASTA
ncbi:MAG: hypothetical protein NXI30_02860 [bacterium]|nr:hypothetical protein [bacterium]